jgi:hypothetical protein
MSFNKLYLMDDKECSKLATLCVFEPFPSSSREYYIDCWHEITSEQTFESYSRFRGVVHLVPILSNKFGQV